MRISKTRQVFTKGYLPAWSEEIFEIVRVRRVANETIYYLRDFAGEAIEGGFYEKEVQRVREPDEYRIERVLRTKTARGGQKLHLVKWKGWPEKFNSWVENPHAL